MTNHKVALKNIAEQLKSVGEARETAMNELAGVRSSMTELREERDHLLRAPVTKAEFVDALCAHIDRLADEGQERMKAQFMRQLNFKTQRIPMGPIGSSEFHIKSINSERPFHFCHSTAGLARVKSYGSWEERPPVSWMGLTMAADMGDEKAERFTVDHVALAVMFGSSIKETIRANFDAIEWPHEEFATIAEREARVQAINTELESLAAVKADLERLIAAAEGGVSAAAEGTAP